jgi:hypothetical protein
MLILRTIDWSIQIIIMVIILLMRLTRDPIDAIVLFALLGCWQAGSAAINTYFFLKSSLSRKIWFYWLFAIINLLLVFSNISISISIAGVIDSGLTAIWYAIILKQLIEIGRYKKTVNGIIKK